MAFTKEQFKDALNELTENVDLSALRDFYHLATTTIDVPDEVVGKIGTLLKSALDAAAGRGWTDLLREAIHDDGLPEGIRNHAKVALQEVTTRPDPKEVVRTYLTQFVSNVNVAGGWDNRTRERVACAFPEHYGPRVEHYRQPGRAGPFQAVFPSRLSR